MTASHFWDLTKAKVFANLKSEASRNYLNYLWWFLEPALQLAVFYLVFGVLLRNRTENFVIFLACGIVPWIWINRTINNAMLSIINGYNLMLYVSFPKIFLPLVVIIQDAIKQLAVFIVLLSLLIFYQQISIYWILLPLVLAIQFIFVSAAALFVSAIVPFLPDLRYIIHALLQLTMLCSGIFYDYHIIPDHYQFYYLLNPVASTIESYRDILLYTRFPSLGRLLYVLGISITLLYLSLALLKKFNNIYPKIITNHT